MDAIELSSDDSDSSCRSIKYFDVLYSKKCIVDEVPVDSELSNGSDSQEMSEPADRASQSSQSQDSRKRKNTRKRDASAASAPKTRTTAAERQATKRKLAEERKAARDANKMYKPGECMKHMTIEMHPALLEAWYCADVAREAAACGAGVRAARDLCDPALVLWSRAVPRALASNHGMLQLSAPRVQTSRGLYVLEARAAAPLVARHELARAVRRARQLAARHLTLVLFGVRDYFRSSGRKTANSGNKLITEMDLEKAITDLLVSADCDAVLVDTPSELALTILHFTKAVAEQPHKQAKREVDEMAQFYMRGDNKKCVAVDRRGAGLARAWQQMLGALPMGSLEKSRALCARYPSPLAMYEALLSSGGALDVGSVGVARSALPGAKQRRVGPEFARKLELLFTATDGNILVD